MALQSASAPRRRAAGAGSKESRPRTASPNSSALTAASAVLPAQNDASQSTSAARAASDRSGHSSPSARRRNITRSRHCSSDLVQGSLPMPMRATPSAKRRAVSSFGSTFIGRSASGTAPRRRTCRPRRLALASSNVTSSRCSMRSPKCVSMSGERKRGRKQDTTLRSSAGDLAHRKERLPRQRGRRIEIGATAIGEQERTAHTAGFRDAIRIGEREQNAGREFAPILHFTAPRRASPLPSSHSRSEWWGGVGGGGRFVFNRVALRCGTTPHPNPPHRFAGGGARPSCCISLAVTPSVFVRATSAQRFAMARASCARRERSRRSSSRRCARSTSLPPSPRSVRRSAMSAASGASSPASTTMRASRGGSGSCRSRWPSSVMRPSRSIAPSSVSSAFASLSAARGGGSRKASVDGIGDAPMREIEREARRDRPQESPAHWRAASDAVCGSSHSR